MDLAMITITTASTPQGISTMPITITATAMATPQTLESAAPSVGALRSTAA
jgi:hypothetical protein